MSLKTSQSLPVENYSVVQQSENGTEFGPNNKIRFRIGSHLGYIDFHTSYLQFNFKIDNSIAKMDWSNDMGADVLIRTWRVLIGGHIVEEIDHPNVLLKTIKYDYGQDLGQSELCEVLDKAGKGTGYQGLNNLGVITVPTEDPCANVKCILDLNFSGVFGSTQTFPVGMTGDVEIEITLEDQKKALRVISQGQGPNKLTANMNFTRGKTVGNNGATTYPVQAGAITTVDFLPEPAGTVEGLRDKSSSLATINRDILSDIPFCVGHATRLTADGGADGAGGQYNSAPANCVINGIVNNAGNGNQYQIAFGGGGHTIPSVQELSEVSIELNTNFALGGVAGSTWDNQGTLNYTVSVPTLCLQVVVPPQQYIQEQARKVAMEGYSIDIPTYTCYKSNTFAGIQSAVLDIPCYSSRARSILAIGTPSNQALGGNNILNAPYEMGGFYNDLDRYQFQIGEDRQPVRPVNCSPLSTFQHNVAQEQITEAEKALRSAGCNVRSLRKHRRNFVLGRALSSYGGSIPLTMKGARIYLDYLQTNRRDQAATAIVNKDWFIYVHHIRRLNITPQGVSVMY